MGKKKTCNGCRALEMLSGDPPRCLLHYKITLPEIAPAVGESCPKPKSNSALIDAKPKKGR